MIRDFIPPIIVLAASGTGFVILGLLVWQMIRAIGRSSCPMPTPASVTLLLDRLAAATRAGQPWEPALLGLRVYMHSPWSKRLTRAAELLANGDPPDLVLASSSLLPRSLRAQAAQALRQGPDAFALWCDSVRDRVSPSPLVVRQQAFLVTEALALGLALWFLVTYVFPKFSYLVLDLGVPLPPLLKAHATIDKLWMPALMGVALLAMAGWTLVVAIIWRRRRRLAAARLLLFGAAARLPEAALGTAGDFPALCRAAGWRADDPTQLARAVARAEVRDAVRAAWLPSLLASAAPFVAAIPVGLVVIGLFQLLISILTGLEAG